MEARCIFLIAVIYVLSISMVNSRGLVDLPKASEDGSMSYDRNSSGLPDSPNTEIHRIHGDRHETIAWWNRVIDSDAIGSGYSENENIFQEYRWEDYNQNLENNSRVVRTQQDYESYIIIRTLEGTNDNVPTELLIRRAKEFYESHNYQILLADPDTYEWIPSSNGTVPKNAIVGGNLRNDTLYICRILYINVNYVNYYIGGYMQPRERGCITRSIDGVRSDPQSVYDLLVFK